MLSNVGACNCVRIRGGKRNRTQHLRKKGSTLNLVLRPLVFSLESRNHKDVGNNTMWNSGLAMTVSGDAQGAAGAGGEIHNMCIEYIGMLSRACWLDCRERMGARVLNY